VEEVIFYVQGTDRTLYFTELGITIALTRTGEGALQREIERYIIKIGFEFEGANSVKPVGRDRQEAVFSYFRGRPEDWKTGCSTYGLWQDRL